MALPHSRLFLKLSRLPETGSPRDCIEAALQAGDVAALLIDGRANTELMSDVAELVSIAQDKDVAALIAEDALLARRSGADGVQISADLAAYQSVRKDLGEQAIVGVDAGRSRHAAMELAEAGASYVSFGDGFGVDELSEWWAEVMEVPCVAHVAATEEALAAAAGAGLEFVSPDESVWHSPDEAAGAVARFNEILAGAPVS
ncbi:MAG: thiamine phosphate synthase [Pseudomonadota bacterium]